MKILIAVPTCHARIHQADSQRATWVRDIPALRADIRFFCGLGARREPRLDEVFLDCGDDYGHLPAKVKAMLNWSRQRAYDWVFKCDDDNYVCPERLLASGFEKYDYTGHQVGPTGKYPHPYAMGGAGYWVSRAAMDILITAPDSEDWAEDRWVGNTLANVGIELHHDGRYLRAQRRPNPRVFDLGSNLIGSAEFDPEEMILVHNRNCRS